GVPRLHLRGRDVGAASVQGDVAVQHELTRLPTRIGKAQTVDNVIQARLQHPQQILASDARHVLGRDEMLVELALENAVDVARLLFFLELDAELAFLAAATVAWR